VIFVFSFSKTVTQNGLIATKWCFLKQFSVFSLGKTKPLKTFEYSFPSWKPVFKNRK
jgi:hypothetical protein